LAQLVARRAEPPDAKLLAFVSNRDGQRAIYFANVDPSVRKPGNIRRMPFQLR
jgi:Tol biopolymer transport system component